MSNALVQAANLRGLLASAEPQADRDILIATAVQCSHSLSKDGEFLEAVGLLTSAFESTSLEAGSRDSVILELCDTLIQADQANKSRRLLDRITGRFPVNSAEASRREFLIAQADWRLGAVGAAIDRLTRLLARLQVSEFRDLEARVAAATSGTYVHVGDWKQAEASAMQAIVLGQRAGVAYAVACGWANLGLVSKAQGRWASATDALGRALEIYEVEEYSWLANRCRHSLALVAWKRGRLADAEERLREVAESRIGIPSVYSSLLDCAIKIHRGKAELARAALGSVQAVATSSDPRPRWLLSEYSADILLEQGKFDEALPLIDELLPRVTALVPRGDIATELYRRRAECLLHAGKIESGLAAVREAESIAQECGDVFELACSLRVLALLLARSGKPVDAQAAFARAFQLFDEIQTPYEWGKLWMSYGDWLCSDHASHYFSLRAAADAYRAALEHFDAMRAEFKFAEAQKRIEAVEKRMQSERDQLAADSEIRPRPRRRPIRDMELNRRSQWAFETYGIVTRYRPLLDMLEEIGRLSVSDIPVLVLGESGTGKELVSHAIHELSGRVGDYMAINCSAIQATMLEAELFGFVRGSFTGAERDKPGLIEIAHQGSLFLDEIGEMSPDLQAKLLRFLENGSFRRVGSTSDVKVKVRVIAATNREQAKLASGQGFRSDLYFRLAHAVYTLPPLREREGDAEVLIDHFLEVFGEETGKRVRLSSASRDRLLEYTWPGNVRQLRGLMHRLVAQSERDTIITPRDIKLEEAAAPRDFIEEMESEERKRILDALEKSGGVKANAARMLRLSRTTMLAKMKRYGIPL